MSKLSEKQKAAKAEYARKWRRDNAYHLHLYATAYRKKNKKRIKANQRRWINNNRERVKALALASYYRNPQKTRDRQLRLAFGITLEQYENLLKQQNNRCAICNCPPSGPKSFAVDHCHSSGKVRGLLCRGCNVGIGNLKDSISILESAIIYLSKYDQD